MVPNEQANDASPTEPVHAFKVVVPTVTTAAGLPTSFMPAGSASDSTTVSASDRPGPILLRTLISKLKGSNRATGERDGVLLTTSTSARVRTLVDSLSVLLSGLVSQPAVISGDDSVATFSATPRAVPAIVTPMTRVAPESISGMLQDSEPPVGPLQVTPAGTLTDWKERKFAGRVSVTTTFCAAEGPLLVTISP